MMEIKEEERRSAGKCRKYGGSKVCWCNSIEVES
jgi:hypothetical protein